MKLNEKLKTTEFDGALGKRFSELLTGIIIFSTLRKTWKMVKMVMYQRKRRVTERLRLLNPHKVVVVVTDIFKIPRVCIL